MAEGRSVCGDDHVRPGRREPVDPPRPGLGRASAAHGDERLADARKADVARENEVRGLVDAPLARFDRLDILVNNAGVMVHGSFLEIPVARYDEMFAINVTGTLLCTRHALPAMMARRYGRIVNLSYQLDRPALGSGGFPPHAPTQGPCGRLTPRTPTP